MIIKGYGLELIRLKHEDIELVRNWRNSEHVTRYMEYREHITPEMQEKWFRSIDNIYNNYFVISVNGKKIGLINGSEINWEKNETGNGGIFIWDKDHSKSLDPLRASLLLTDFSFVLGFERTFIKVLKDNVNGVSYNINLGYELLPGQDNIYNQRYVLTKENYLSKTKKLKEMLLKFSPDEISVIIDDPEHPSSEMILKKYEALDTKDKKAVSFIISKQQRNG